jgi:PadR family transcriptional regulator, regulatory protein PadR
MWSRYRTTLFDSKKVRSILRSIVRAEWGASENNRRARYYSITAAGRRQLAQEEKNWAQLTEAVGKVLRFA